MRHELLVLTFLVLAGAGAGATLSSPLAGLFAGVCVWAGLQFRQLLRFRRWLAAGADAEAAPRGEGLWGEVYRRASLRKRGLDERESARRVRLEEGVVALPYGFVIVSHGGRIEWFNAAAAKMLHLSDPDDVNREIGHLIRSPDFVAALESAGAGTELELNLFGRFLAVYVSSFGDGGYRLVVVQDVSRVRYLERARSELLGNVAHELKTPLTVVGGYAEIIAASADANTGEAAVQIGKQTERMNRIVENLLTLERLEESLPLAHDADKVDLRRLVDEVVREEEMVAPAGRCRIEIAVAEGVTLRGDRRDLHSVLSNLVGNAVRYSPEGGVVRVSWSQDAGVGRLSVSDEGPGIDPTHLPRLTERFYRVDKSRSRELGGTGLGLAIVKHALQKHGASLRVESELGKGSTFHCEFPEGSFQRTAR